MVRKLTCGHQGVWGVLMVVGFALFIGGIALMTSYDDKNSYQEGLNENIDFSCRLDGTCENGKCYEDEGGKLSQRLCCTEIHDCDVVEGKNSGGFALIVLGLILGFTFCCGVVPCCCFAREELPHERGTQFSGVAGQPVPVVYAQAQAQPQYQMAQPVYMQQGAPMAQGVAVMQQGVVQGVPVGKY